MTNNETLAARIEREAREKAEAAQKEADTVSEIARSWDASGFNLIAPWIVRGDKGIYGDRATLHFRDVGPDDLVAMMRAFPALERAEYKHNNTRYFHPIGGREIPTGADVTMCDGYEIEVSGGKGYDSLHAHWSAMVGGIQTKFYVDLRRVSFLHPRAYRRAVTINHQFIRYEGPAALVWPSDQMRAAFDAADVFARSYGSGDQSAGDFRIRGRGVLALAVAWEAEANRRQCETRAAFAADLEPAQRAGLVPTADDVKREADRIADRYNAEKLRAGTLEQTAALQTPHALRDRELAEKHWLAYAERFGIETRQKYFEHYPWACAFLQRCGLYEVAIEGREKPYRYGHAWL